MFYSFFNRLISFSFWLSYSSFTFFIYSLFSSILFNIFCIKLLPISLSAMWFTVPASLYWSAIFDNSPSAILFILFSFIAEVCYRLGLDILFNCLIDSRALNLLVNVRSVLLRVINGLRNRLFDYVCSLMTNFSTDSFSFLSFSTDSFSFLSFSTDSFSF